MTHDLGKVYYESKYSSRSLGLFLRFPLVELRPFADAYPAEFLRGLFSADGCADVCTDNGCLRLQIVLGNSNPELLGLVTSLLQSHFQLHSNTYLRKRKGATWKNGSKTVFLRKDAYALQIQRVHDVRVFVDKIGFVIARKQHVAEQAILLNRTVGSSRAAVEWRKHYSQKRGGRWHNFGPSEGLISPRLL